MNYNYAIVRGVAKSLVDFAQRIDDNHESISLETIAKQKQAYYNVIEETGLKLIKIDADETLPDCVFTEDAAIIVEKVCFLFIKLTKNSSSTQINWLRSF